MTKEERDINTSIIAHFMLVIHKMKLTTGGIETGSIYRSMVRLLVGEYDN